MSLENFLALLEYLYTDHAPIEEGDSVGILELSNKYVLPRLMASVRVVHLKGGGGERRQRVSLRLMLMLSVSGAPTAW